MEKFNNFIMIKYILGMIAVVLAVVLLLQLRQGTENDIEIGKSIAEEAILVQKLPDKQSARVMIISDDNLYVGTNRGPAEVYKIDKNNLDIKKTLILDGFGFLASGFIHNEDIYFGTGTSPANIVKVSLDDFKVKDSLKLEEYYSEAISAYETDGMGFFGFYPFPGRLIQVDLGKMEMINEKKWDNIKDINLINSQEGIFMAGRYDIGGTILGEIDTNSLKIKDEGQMFIESATDGGIIIDEMIYLPTVGFPPEIVSIDRDTLIAIKMPLKVEDNKFLISKLIYYENENQFIILTGSSPCRFLIADLNFNILEDEKIRDMNDCGSGVLDKHFLYLGSKFLSAERNQSSVARVDLRII